MAAVSNFAVTSQSFAVVEASMAERMARTEVVLAQNTSILDQVQQHLGLPPIPLTLAATATGSQAPPPAALVAIIAATLTAPLTAHHSTPAQSQDED